MNNDWKKKQSHETHSQYIGRICASKKQFNLTWKDVQQICNKELGVVHSDSWYRKGYKNGDFDLTIFGTSGYVSVVTTDQVDKAYVDQKIQEATVTTSASSDDCCNGDCENCPDFLECLYTAHETLEEQQEELNNTLLELRKEKVKVSDEKNQMRAYVRRIAREETIKEIASEFADKMNKKYLLPAPAEANRFNNEKQPREGILLLSDWHYGMVCDNAWNKFDPDICQKRVSTLLLRVCEQIQRNKLQKVTVLNLSDLIAGRIHTQIRIESRCDVITQTMEVSELLADFLNQLSLITKVDFYDCLDNHSRLEPNKNDSMDLESLVRIIPWYLRQRLSHNSQIRICDNEFSADIITCKVLSHDVIGVHGDHDSPINGIDKLSLMTHRHYDLFCTAHRHHMYCEEKNHCIIVGNSSLMGTDSYAEKLRLSCDPSQTLIIATEDNVCECIYRIKLV